MTPTEQDKELREKLAAIEHERWADWQRYVHSVCYENKGIGGEPTGELIIPSELARGWERQIGTPYQELTEKEKDSDREQVDRYWQLITAQINQARIEAQKEILAFATRVQANGQYIPIEVGLIPWLEAQLSNTHKEQL